MQTAIYYGIKHFGYIACYIAENRLYTMLYTMLYSISYILKTVLGLLNAIEPIFGYIAWYIACSTVLGLLRRRFYDYIGRFLALYNLP